MKVKILTRKGNNEAGTTLEYPDATAEWLIAHGYAEAADDSEPQADSDTAAPRRGRPSKAAQ